jgi:hypothetical protein
MPRIADDHGAQRAGGQAQAAAHRDLVSPGGCAAVRLGRAAAARLVAAVRHAIAGAVGGPAPASPAPPGNPGGLGLELGPLGVCISG